MRPREGALGLPDPFRDERRLEGRILPLPGLDQDPAIEADDARGQPKQGIHADRQHHLMLPEEILGVKQHAGGVFDLLGEAVGHEGAQPSRPRSIEGAELELPSVSVAAGPADLGAHGDTGGLHQACDGVRALGHGV